MLSAPYKSLNLLLLLAPCMTALAIAGVGSQRSPAQDSTQSTSNAPVYFPSRETAASIFSVILASLSEPSLLEAAKDANVLSFRVSFFSPVPVRKVAVRLIVKADGSGQITTAASSGTAAGVKRTQNGVSAADVNRLLKMLEKVEFWSMSSTEYTGEETDAAGRKAYVLDGSFWMLEGVREGSFHYAYRRNPKASPITEIGCYMAKELAKPGDSLISILGCTSHG
jgi:hypothetical protein